ncbi:MAG: hypothetical protein MJY68_01850 [Bacteroidaceae bacterium]|nr:hypothetical protein [Bacteroidaceae bacterium]
MKIIWLREFKNPISKKSVSSLHKQSAKPPGSNSPPRLRFVFELSQSLVDHVDKLSNLVDALKALDSLGQRLDIKHVINIMPKD